MTVHYPVAVVGAGPAGATCANALLLEGASGVALIDKARFPRDKACGDGLGPGVIGVLDELGLTSILDGHQRVTLMSMSSSYGSRFALDTTLHRRRSPLGYVIARMTFDDQLVKAAIARGADDLTGWGLASATHADQRWHLTLSCTETGEARQITADVLVGADGAASKVRRLLGQKLNGDRHTSIAVRVYARAQPPIPAQQRLDVVEGLPNPGYGWVFSGGDGSVNIGIGTDVVAYKAAGLPIDEILARYRSFLGNSFVFDERSIRSCPLPLASELPRLGFPETGAALVGDAASMINPLSGEGIFYGMYAGMLLGRCIAASRARRADMSEALVSYEAAFRRTFRRHFRGTWLMRKMLEKPILLDRMVNACARNCDLSYDYIEYMMGSEQEGAGKPLYNIALRTLAS